MSYYKKGFVTIIILLVAVFVLVGLGAYFYFDNNQKINPTGLNENKNIINQEEIKNEDSDKQQEDLNDVHLKNDDWLIYKNLDGKELFKYPSNFNVQEELSYNFDGTQVVYRSLSINSPDKEKILIGAHRVSTCADVPQATRCAGGGKGSFFDVTFTNSTDPEFIEIFDAVISSMEKYSHQNNIMN